MRYIRLTELTRVLLNVVSEKKIVLNPTYALPFLEKRKQKQHLDVLFSKQSTPFLSQAQRLKRLS